MEPVGLDAIIFDFDGTLSLTAPRQETWFKKWAKMNDKPWPFETFDEFLTIYNHTLGTAKDVTTGVQKFYDDLVIGGMCTSRSAEEAGIRKIDGKTKYTNQNW